MFPYLRITWHEIEIAIVWTQKKISVFRFFGVWVETLRLRDPTFSSFFPALDISSTLSLFWDICAWQVCLSKESFGWTLFPLWSTMLFLLKTFNFSINLLHFSSEFYKKCLCNLRLFLTFFRLDFGLILGTTIPKYFRSISGLILHPFKGHFFNFVYF